MIAYMNEATPQQKKDIRLIGRFVEVYCAGRHRDGATSMVAVPGDAAGRRLCQECRAFFEYAIKKRMKCPLEAEKPSCKHCRIHCYDTANREKIREIMAYSGRRLIMRGRLDYLWHYFF